MRLNAAIRDSSFDAMLIHRVHIIPEVLIDKVSSTRIQLE